MRLFVFKKRSSSVFALAILILIGFLAFSAVSLQSRIARNNQVSKTLIVQQRLDATLSLITSAETSVRGFMGQDNFNIVIKK